MAQTVSDFVIHRLHQWGIRLIYGYPGDGINGLMGALNRAQGHVDFVQTRHEEQAAFMACAHAKFTGEVGICMATSGPGAIHLLNGLYDASMDHQPVVAIIGQQATTALGSDYQQEVDLISLFKDVAYHYVHMCATPAQARHLVDRAMRIAKAERTVTCIIFPNDIQTMDAVEFPPRKHGTTVSGIGHARARIVPDDGELRRAAGILNEGDPKFEASQNLPDFGYAEYAQSLGFEGIVMKSPDDVISGWERALTARRPVLVEAYTDPEVPPLPPHITFEQARNYAESLLKGDPHRWRAIKQSVKDLWGGIVGT